MAERNTVPQVDKDVTMKLFKKFAEVDDVEEETAECIMKCCDSFWEFTSQSWESYALHAGRRHLEKPDIQLHMLRTDLVHDYNDFSAVVHEHLPLELGAEVLELAQAKVLHPKSSKSQKLLQPKSKNMNTSISAGQIYARRKLFSPVSQRPRRTRKKPL